MFLFSVAISYILFSEKNEFAQGWSVSVFFFNKKQKNQLKWRESRRGIRKTFTTTKSKSRQSYLRQTETPRNNYMSSGPRPITLSAGLTANQATTYARRRPGLIGARCRSGPMPIRPKVFRCAVLGCLVNTGVQTLVSCENAIEVCESQKLDGTIVKKRRWLCLKHTGLKKMPEHPEEWFCPGCEDKGTTSHKHRPKRLRLSRTCVVPPDEFHVLVLTFMGGLLQQRLSDMYRYRGLMAIVCGVRPQEIEMYAGQDARAEKDAQCVWIEN